MAATTKYRTVHIDEVRESLAQVLRTKFRGSIDRMAAHAGVSAPYVRMVLRGARNPPAWALKMIHADCVTVYRIAL